MAFAALHPFGRLKRLPYVGMVLACLAVGWLALNVTRFGGEYWKLGPLMFWPALYLLFCAMVNRIRDADASAGWFFFPILMMVLSGVIAFYAGPTDMAGYLFRGTMLEDSFVTLPIRFVLALPSFLFPFIVAMVVSLFFWAFSFLMLAFLPSRALRG